MNNYVFIIETNFQPLKPTTPKRARELMKKGKAAVFRRYPFTLILKQEYQPTVAYLELRVDPGSKYTGFALVNPKNEVVWGMELEHRGQQISQSLSKRGGFRRTRRHRKTRYRKQRFNRTKPKGWLAPSLRHRVQTVETWIKRICRYAPVSTITIEKVKFDTQKLENPDIQGVEYQQGTLAGYSVREALLEHWGRQCAYCGEENTPLQIEHIKPKSQGGSNRFSNLTLACECCNQAKGNRSVEEFLSERPEVLKKIKSHCKKSLADAAAVNSTRHQIFEMAKNTGLNVQAGSGALAKLVRAKSQLPKAHWIDAAANSLDFQPIKLLTHQALLVTCQGHGNRQAVRCNSSGFPAITLRKDHSGQKIVKTVKPKQKYLHARAGDLVNVTLEKDRKHVKKGVYTAQVKTPTKRGVEVKIDGHRISIQSFSFVHRSDGYDYSFGQLLSI
ncbi:MAG: RNA-guided endonuclease IscB [Xenococcus sp. (in: cyanobacteria)]